MLANFSCLIWMPQVFTSASLNEAPTEGLEGASHIHVGGKCLARNLEGALLVKPASMVTGSLRHLLRLRSASKKSVNTYPTPHAYPQFDPTGIRYSYIRINVYDLILVHYETNTNLATKIARIRTLRITLKQIAGCGRPK